MNKYLILAVLPMLLTGCGMFGLFSDTKTKPPNSTEVRPFKSPEIAPTAEETPAPKEVQVVGDVVLTWRSPPEAAEGFFIYFGYSPDKLNQEKRVSMDEIESLIDEIHGKVFRYVLHGIETKSLYVSIASFAGGIVSERSLVRAVSANAAPVASPAPPASVPSQLDRKAVIREDNS